MFVVHSKDPSIAMNYAVLLHKQGDRQAAVKIYQKFEERVQACKTNSEDVDPEVRIFLI